MHSVWRCPLAQETFPCFAAAGPDRAAAANHLPLPSALPRSRVVVLFRLFICCLLGLDVSKYLSGLPLVSPNLPAGYGVKSESFLDLFLLLHV